MYSSTTQTSASASTLRHPTFYTKPKSDQGAPLNALSPDTLWVGVTAANLESYLCLNLSDEAIEALREAYLNNQGSSQVHFPSLGPSTSLKALVKPTSTGAVSSAEATYPSTSIKALAKPISSEEAWTLPPSSAFQPEWDAKVLELIAICGKDDYECLEGLAWSYINKSQDEEDGKSSEEALYIGGRLLETIC